MNNTLSIRLNEEHVGTLQQSPSGKMLFTYVASATQAISIAMPVREEPYDEALTEAYFGGLLPESELAKKIIGKKYNISPHNHFALLKAIGHDCAGAISCHATDDSIKTQRTTPLTGRVITNDELYEHIKALPQKPLFIDVDGLRLSLAGVQDKAAVCLIDNQIALAEDGCPTTHIIKPASPYFDNMAENEYFCLKVAKHIGLPVPSIELRQIKDITFLLIERYDRKIKDGCVERIHQEDFCQALGVYSSKKYQNEGGPAFKDCFELLNHTAQPAIDRNFLASALVFNYLIGNMDAHGKNFSLLHHSPTHIRLAPFYDMICTRVYPELSAKMAMKIGNQYDAHAIFPRHWEQLCKEIRYNHLALTRLINHQAESILKAAIEERDILLKTQRPANITDRILKVLEENIKLHLNLR